MDEAKNHALPTFAMLVGVGCILCTLVTFITMGRGDNGGCFPLVLTVYGPVLFGVDRLFLRRQRTMMSLTLLNIGALAALLVLIFLTGGYQGAAMAIITVLVCVYPTFQAGQRALEPPPVFAQILTVDASFLVLLIFTGYTAATEQPLSYCLPICAGCAASLLGLILRRSGGELHGRGWAMVAAAFVGVLALLWLLVSVAAAPAGAGVVRLWTGLKAALEALGRLLGQLILFLASLLPAPETDGAYQMEMENPAIPQIQETVRELSPGVLMVLTAAGIILALVLLTLILRALSRLRIGGTRRVKAPRARTGRPSLLEGLRLLWAAWLRRIALLHWLRRHRQTPDGIYFLLVRRSRKAPWHKRPGETPREFLTRLKAAAESDSDLRNALEALMAAVDAALYAPSPQTVTLPQADLIRRRMGAAVRRQALRRLGETVLRPLKAVKLPGFQTHNC